MKKSEKAQFELDLKNILYLIEDTQEQGAMIAILEKYNDSMPDGKIKDALQKAYYKIAKNNYYAKVDFLIKDILNGKGDRETRKKIPELLKELRPSIEAGQKKWYEKLIGLSDWT